MRGQSSKNKSQISETELDQGKRDKGNGKNNAGIAQWESNMREHIKFMKESSVTVVPEIMNSNPGTLDRFDTLQDNKNVNSESDDKDKEIGKSYWMEDEEVYHRISSMGYMYNPITEKFYVG